MVMMMMMIEVERTMVLLRITTYREMVGKTTKDQIPTQVEMIQAMIAAIAAAQVTTAAVFVAVTATHNALQRHPAPQMRRDLQILTHVRLLI